MRRNDASYGSSAPSHLFPGLIFSLFLFVPSAGAFCFEGFTDVPGGHMEAARTAFLSVYRAPVSTPTLVRTIPIYDISTYRWDGYHAADLLSDAARDIDSFYFGLAYPHGQTPDFSYKRQWTASELKAMEEAALTDYLVFFASTLSEVRRLYESGDSWKATYRLGVLLHAYQDLWAHRGITNAQHLALEKYRNLNVDRDEGRIQEMRVRLSSWIADLPTLLGEKGGSAFRSYLLSGDIIKVPRLSDRKRMLKRGRDIFLQGIKFKLFTPSPESCLEYLDAVQWDLDALDRVLHDGRALEAIASSSQRLQAARGKAKSSALQAMRSTVEEALSSAGYRY